MPDGLLEKVPRAELRRPDGIVDRGMSAHHDDRRRRVSKPLEKLDAIAIRQTHIKQTEGGGALPEDRFGFGDRPRGLD